MRLWWLMAVFLLKCGLNVADDLVNKGCIVEKNLTYVNKPQSVKFAALIQNNDTVLEAHLACSEKYWEADSWKITTDNTGDIWVQKRGGESKLMSSGAREGWMDLYLDFESETYRLLDSQGRPLITGHCKLWEAYIVKGALMSDCDKGTLVWNVESNECVNLPILQQDSNWTMDLSFSSQDSFRPSFRVKTMNLVLGWLDEGLTVLNEEDVKASPVSGSHCLTLRLTSDTTFEVLVGNRMDFKARLISAPDVISVCGNESQSFTVQDVSSSGCFHPETHHAPVIAESSGILYMSLGITFGLIFVFGVSTYWFRYKQSKGPSPSPKPNAEDHPPAAPSGTPPLYLDPIVPVTRCHDVPSVDPHLVQRSSGSSGSSHPYDEAYAMNECIYWN